MARLLDWRRLAALAFALLSSLWRLRWADAFHRRSSFPLVPLSAARRSTTILFSERGGDSALTNIEETKDFSAQTSSLFSNIRVPAALFAGASAASAFALPILPSDSLVVGFAKRIYALLMTGALSSQLIAIIVSTTCMFSIAVYEHAPTTSVNDFIAEHYEFEWCAILVNFVFARLINGHRVAR